MEERGSCKSHKPSLGVLVILKRKSKSRKASSAPVVSGTQTVCLCTRGYFKTALRQKQWGRTGNGDLSLRHRQSQHQRLHLDKITGCQYPPEGRTESKQTRIVSFHGSRTDKHSAQVTPAYNSSTPGPNNPGAQAGPRRRHAARARPIQVRPQRTTIKGESDTGHSPAEPEAARLA